ncbi:hypothetical protein M427DRAFT_381981 [Gonapodya prolifera JEL478]|uniref:ribonuclease Z n=1 Tax=Gonapodya prolifera (strain JEL478) TaxID=1344416 RepID=A0A139AA77_GONPJ|nr:hypothetical protein M427DRAFT_381981 [Gonapodya prolifera JEL478]|eukprot:KXS13273.1 hypothetical protein M427DRAFT_381981 [Gonapodya prolifera JEL478]
MRWHLQLLSAHSADSSPSLLLSFDSARYLVNAGEGLQRIAVSEHRKGLTSKLRNVFVTRVDWGETVGGIPGLLLTLAAGIDQPKNEVHESAKRKADSTSSSSAPIPPRNVFTIHGPENITDVIISTRHFVHRYTVNIRTNELNKFRRFLDTPPSIPNATSTPSGPSAPATATASAASGPGTAHTDVIFSDDNISVKAYEISPSPSSSSSSSPAAPVSPPDDSHLDPATIHTDPQFQLFAMKKLALARMFGDTGGGSAGSGAGSGGSGAATGRGTGQDDMGAMDMARPLARPRSGGAKSAAAVNNTSANPSSATPSSATATAPVQNVSSAPPSPPPSTSTAPSKPSSPSRSRSPSRTSRSPTPPTATTHQSPLHLAQTHYLLSNPTTPARIFHNQSTPAPPHPRKPCTVAYLVTASTYPGKFSITAAHALGVAPGADYKVLQSGGRVRVRLREGKEVPYAPPPRGKLSKAETAKRHEQVKREREREKEEDWGAEGVDWRWVRAEEVVAESRGGGMILVVDLPNPLYLHTLLTHPTLSPILANPPPALHAIVYFLHPSVLSDAQFRHTLTRLTTSHPSLRHVVCARTWNAGAVTFGRAQDIAHKLAALDDIVFRRAWADPGVSPEEEERDVRELFGPAAVGSVAVGKPLLKLDIEPPPTAFDAADIPHWFRVGAVSQEVQEEVREVQDVIDAYKADVGRGEDGGNQKAVDDLPVSKDDWRKTKELVIVPLGTGGSLPSKYRNVSSTLLVVPSSTGPPGVHLFDTGENTYGQLVRHFGPDEITHVMENLRMLAVSHLHADHHMGTVRLLREYAKINLGSVKPRPLFLVAPRRFLNFLQEYNELEDLSLDHITFIANEVVSGWVATETRERTLLARGFREGTGLTDIVAVSVKHCPSAYAVVVKGPRVSSSSAHGVQPSGGEEPAGQCDDAPQNGPRPLPFLESREFKFVFSGDCRPSEHLARVGKDATLLVHEATFDDSLAQEAADKSHCTVGEAVQVAEKWVACTLVVTYCHFFSNVAVHVEWLLVTSC